MWYLLRRFGLERGHVLDPTAGHGLFQDTKPSGVMMTAVEPSPMEPFVKATATRYDAVIGHVQVGSRGTMATVDKPELVRVEEYVVDTCLDKTKEGGMVCLLVPQEIATHATSQTFRKRVMTKAEVVGVHRLPQTAFHAMPTDMLLLRKRPQDVGNALGIVDDVHLQQLGVWDQQWLDGAILDDPDRGHVHEMERDQVPEAVATSPLPYLPDDELTMADVAHVLAGQTALLQKAVRAANTDPYPGPTKRRFKLILKSFPGHKGRPGEQGGSQKRDRSEEVEKEFKEAGSQKDDRRTYDEKKMDEAARWLTRWVKENPRSRPREIYDAYRNMLQQVGVTEPFRVRELKRVAGILGLADDESEPPSDRVQKSVPDRQTSAEWFPRQFPRILLRLRSARDRSWETPYVG